MVESGSLPYIYQVQHGFRQVVRPYRDHPGESLVCFDDDGIQKRSIYHAIQEFLIFARAAAIELR
jgi:hypothetical protein